MLLFKLNPVGFYLLLVQQVFYVYCCGFLLLYIMIVKGLELAYSLRQHHRITFGVSFLARDSRRWWVHYCYRCIHWQQMLIHERCVFFFFLTLWVICRYQGQDVVFRELSCTNFVQALRWLDKYLGATYRVRHLPFRYGRYSSLQHHHEHDSQPSQGMVLSHYSSCIESRGNHALAGQGEICCRGNSFSLRYFPIRHPYGT